MFGAMLKLNLNKVLLTPTLRRPHRFTINVKKDVWKTSIENGEKDNTTTKKRMTKKSRNSIYNV